MKGHHHYAYLKNKCHGLSAPDASTKYSASTLVIALSTHAGRKPIHLPCLCRPDISLISADSWLASGRTHTLFSRLPRQPTFHLVARDDISSTAIESSDQSLFFMVYPSCSLGTRELKSPTTLSHDGLCLCSSKIRSDKMNLCWSPAGKFVFLQQHNDSNKCR